MSQSVQTMSELMDFCAVPYHIISPKDGKPVITFVQDTLLGCFRLTKKDVHIADKTFANLQMVNSYFDGTMPKPVTAERKYNGQQAYTMILPPGVWMEMKKVSIKNSVLSDSGNLDKGCFNSLSKGLIPVIFHDHGPFETRRFMDNTQRLICRWLMSSGFSVGISDLIIEDSASVKVVEKINDVKRNVFELIGKARDNKLDNHSLFNNRDHFEMEVMGMLNAVTKIGESMIDTLDDNANRMLNMIKAGSKGSYINVAQMIACVGQQNVDNKRIAYGFTDRTLPHYNKYDDGPEARGFVENSFINGLTPQEVYFHAMGGREGLIDTAVKSVIYETPIVIIEDGKPKYVKIGEWIDAHLDGQRKAEVEHSPEDRNLELLHLEKKVYIPTGDGKGNVSWGELTAVTRHDPGERLYEVETQSGRKVTVAESESLLIWNAEKEEFIKKHSTLVKVGDSVPVITKLPEPPIIVKEVNMEEYFPKSQYIWGSEFHKATDAMKKAQGTKFFIPRGWWQENNGKTFVVPYTKKASLTRVNSGRSNTENVKVGCIYPYHAKRDSCLMPDKFELNKDFGIFIGLYLAEGCTHEKSGHTSIANNDRKIKDFVIAWFNKHKMAHYEETREMVLAGQNNSGESSTGTTSSVFGYSTLMARFLDKFVGHGAEQKFVPTVAFVAPEEFVIGLLNGYFAGDGSVGPSGISASSISPRLIEGISMLCNRLGIFGKIRKSQTLKNNLGTVNIRPTYTIDIRSHWATQFAEKIAREIL